MASQGIAKLLTDFANFVGDKDREIHNIIGVLSRLETKQKSTLVSAINELKQLIDGLSTNSAGINDSATNEASTLSAKKIIELVNQAKTDAKSEILGGNVAAELDTIKELADALNGIKTGEDGLNKLIQKVAQFNESVSSINQKLNDLDSLDLKSAYNQGDEL